MKKIYEDRLEYELSVIEQMGFADYFLVLSDIVREAKARGIPVGPARGSAGGSLVAYLLGIIDIDPIEYDLVFERFLNIKRKGLPDIDIDIADSRRDEIVEWVRETYGRDRVANLGTYGTIGAKAALHDSARILGEPRAVSNILVSKLPRAVFGKQPSLKDARKLPETPVTKLARELEGRTRNEGVHAAGVIISPEPLTECVPTRVVDGAIVTQFDMEDCESVGLVKIDLLGIRTLTVIDETLKLIQQNHHKTVVLSTKKEDLTDPKVFELLRKGDTGGLFQLDGYSATQTVKAVQPTEFEDIVAVMALGRPGPMAQGAHTEYGQRKRESQ